jgi:uncharacterized protein (TIGR03435 family)
MKQNLFAICLGLATSAWGFQSFEVATIKPNAANDNRAMIQIQPGGRFVATGMSLKQLIAFAYDMRDFQITGEPGWVSAERYDINAKGEGAEAGPDVLRIMMRGLLADRFKLKAHEESKEMSIYALVVGKGGSKMVKSVGEGPGPMIRMGRGMISGKGMPMELLVRQLSQNVGRTVLDKTELTGNYDIELSFSAEAGPGGLPGSPDAVAGTGSNGPTIFTAVQEQLGLKLEPAKGPVKMLAVDSVSKPTEN